MANYYFNSTNSVFAQTVNTNALHMTGGDNLFLATDGFLMSWGSGSSSGLYIDAYATNNSVIVKGDIYGTSSGIYSLGAYVSIDVLGSVQAQYTAIRLGGVGNDVSIGKYGYVAGSEGISLGGSFNSVLNHGTIIGDGGNAIQIGGQYNRIHNAGEINGGYTSIFIDALDTYIQNSGTIIGGISIQYLEGSARLTIENSGVWHGDLFFTNDYDELTNTGSVVGSVYMKAGVDVIVNSGTIDGSISLGDGNDFYEGQYGVVTGGAFGWYYGDVSGGAGDDYILGGRGDEYFLGGGGKDVIRGRGGDDVLDGGGNQDRLFGGQGDDTIIGGGGADRMTGGAGADIFVFNSILDSGSAAASRDVITDFQKGLDLIDLSTIDADITLAGNQAFTFIGSNAFSAPGQVRAVTGGGNTVVAVSNDADNSAEMAITLLGLFTLTADDFLL